MIKLSHELGLRQQLTPQQVLQANIFQLNIISLEQSILNELEINPALELVDEKDDDESTEEQEEEKEKDDDEAAELDEKTEETEFEWEELLGDPDEYEIRAPIQKPEEELDAPIRATSTISERLLQQFWDLSPTDDEVKIAEELIGNIDDEGYLTIDPILIADRMMVDENLVLSILKKIQQLDPVGIGARNLRECLIAQVEGVDENSLMVRILRDYFDDFANKRYPKILKGLNCTREELQEASELIATLNPKPGLSGEISERDYIIPDLTAVESDDGWVVTVNNSMLPEFGINKKYVKMALAYKNNQEVKKFVKQKLESAKWFIDAIRQRHNTLINVMVAIIEKQYLFFGKPHQDDLIPMILKDIAEEVRMDISTISRVTNGKYVQLPFGIYELKSFFSEGIMSETGEMVSNTVVKTRLKEIIDAEDKQQPHGDEELVKLLQVDGYNIARRTVAKYRDLLKIPVARLRKEI